MFGINQRDMSNMLTLNKNKRYLKTRLLLCQKMLAQITN